MPLVFVRKLEARRRCVDFMDATLCLDRVRGGCRDVRAGSALRPRSPKPESGLRRTLRYFSIIPPKMRSNLEIYHSNRRRTRTPRVK